MTWFWFAFLHWTLASVNLCINQATKNLHAQMMMTVWELLLRLQEILQILSVAQAHVHLEMGGASKSKHHWRTPTWMRRLLQSGQALHTQKWGGLLLCDGFLGIFSCAWTTSVVDLTSFLVAHVMCSWNGRCQRIKASSMLIVLPTHENHRLAPLVSVSAYLLLAWEINSITT